MAKVKMLRTVTVSYKYEWLMKGDIYDTDKVPAEVKAKIEEAVSKGKAVVVDAPKGKGVAVNSRSLELEKKLKEEAEGEAALKERALKDSGKATKADKEAIAKEAKEAADKAAAEAAEAEETEETEETEEAEGEAADETTEESAAPKKDTRFKKKETVDGK